MSVRRTPLILPASLTAILVRAACEKIVKKTFFHNGSVSFTFISIETIISVTDLQLTVDRHFCKLAMSNEVVGSRPKISNSNTFPK